MAVESPDSQKILTTREAFALIGPPASGKSSHATTFAEILGAELIRGRDISPEDVPNYEAERKLIPDGRFVPALQRRLDEAVDGASRIYFFDNIPRTVGQAEVLTDWSLRRHVALHTIVLILPKEEVRYRFQQRQVCEVCGTSYHPILKPSRVDGKCDRDLADLKRRVGDKEENIDQAYSHYEDILKRVVPVLARVGTVDRISALGTIPETASTIALRFNLQSYAFRSQMLYPH